MQTTSGAEASANTKRPGPLPWTLNWFACLLILSGASALIYEVAWVRLLGLSMGSTSEAVSTVLSAFFFGLALGSLIAHKLPKRRPLVTYLFLEGVIGLCGLALLPALLNLDAMMIPLAELGMRVEVKFLVTLALLSLPTLCMGATFPIVANGLIKNRVEIGNRISQLYALNTVGGIVGTLAAGFLLIPFLGIDGAVYVAVILNALVVVLGVVFISKMPTRLVAAELTPATGVSEGESVNERDANASTAISPSHTALVILFSTGLIAIGTQVGWTKYLSLFTGATIYGFSVILAVFLSGIALGSWAAKYYLSRFKFSRNLLWGLLISLCLSLVLARVLLTWVPDIALWYGRQEWSELYRPLIVFGVVAMCLLIPTALFGAVFPIATAAYCRDTTSTSKRIGIAYSVNTLGGILGAVAAGFWIIPSYGTDVLLTGGAITLAVLTGGLYLRGPFAPSAIRLALAVAIVAGAWRLPHIDYRPLVLAVQAKQDQSDAPDPTFLFLKEGKAGVISLTTSNDRIASLRNNALPESYVMLKGFERSPGIEVLLGIFPYLIHEDPRTSFLIGLGAAHTLNAQALTELTSIRVAELEPAVLAAISTPNGPPPVLDNPAVELTFNDARNALMLESRQYDLISSQPSHPWIAGAGTLFTREFFALVSSRLNEGGLFTQWLNLFQMDTNTLKSVLRAFYEEFPHGFAARYPKSNDLLLIGSNEPVVFDLERMATRITEPALRERLASLRIYEPLDVLQLYALSRSEALTAAGDATPNSDLNLLSETMLARLGNRGISDPNIADLFAEYGQFDLAQLESSMRAQVLYELGVRHLKAGASGSAARLLQQLRQLDADRAKDLELRIQMGS